MNKFRSLVFAVSIVCICLTSLSSALAQDELSDSWRVYQESRAIFNDSFTQLNNSWDLVDTAWVDLERVWNEWYVNWAVIEDSWVRVESERALIASELGITLYDVSQRITRWTAPRSVTRTVEGRAEAPWTSEASSGSWEELAAAFATLDAAWAVSNSQWEKINRAWPELTVANDEATAQWRLISNAYTQVREARFLNEDTRNGSPIIR